MELIQGELVTGSYIIEKITVNTKYVEIQLINDTTKILGILKDNIDLFSKTYQIGEKVVCKGRVRKRRKNFCLDIIYISKNILEQQVNKKIDSQKLIDRFYELVESVSDEDYKNILENCFNDDIKEIYFTYPAAQNVHHNYTHGLLEHSIEVVDISLSIADYFGKVNRDLLICAGLLHDIGKLKSYDIDDELKVVKTDWEKLLGHLSMSSLFVSKITSVETDQKKVMHLYHIVLSHHGHLEFGSPIECKTKEAYIISKSDEISSTINRLDLLKYDENGWSEKDNTSFNRFWFRG